jgi:drug/metabolite transporter (DMT)-like permease
MDEHFLANAWSGIVCTCAFVFWLRGARSSRERLFILAAGSPYYLLAFAAVLFSERIRQPYFSAIPLFFVVVGALLVWQQQRIRSNLPPA